MSQIVNEHLTIQAEQSALPLAMLGEAIKRLMTRTNWSRGEIEIFQKQRLKALVQHAIQHSHYYAEAIGPLFARDAPFEAYPSLTKQMLMDNFDRIVTDKNLTRQMVEHHLDGDQSGTLLDGKYRTVATSGSTGMRGVFVYDEAAWLEVMAVIVRVQRQMGMTTATRSIGIGAPGPMHISNRMFAERRAAVPEVPRLDVTMPLERVVAALNAYQPEVIITYPSFIRTLASEQQSGRLKIMPEYFRTAAEALLPEVVNLVFNVWACPVYQGYACSEAGSVANECKQRNGMHIAEDHLIFEAVDEANRPVTDGTQGAKCLITPLGNFALPLIRYELSDLVTVSKQPCACGQCYARITAIEGRSEERMTFTAKDGTQVEFGAIAFKAILIGMQAIKQFQILHRHDYLRLRIVLNKGASKHEVQNQVDEALRQMLCGHSVELSPIEFEFAEAIERPGSSAKERQFARL